MVLKMSKDSLSVKGILSVGLTSSGTSLRYSNLSPVRIGSCKAFPVGKPGWYSSLKGIEGRIMREAINVRKLLLLSKLLSNVFDFPTEKRIANCIHMKALRDNEI